MTQNRNSDDQTATFSNAPATKNTQSGGCGCRNNAQNLVNDLKPKEQLSSKVTGCCKAKIAEIQQPQKHCCRSKQAS